MAGIRRSSVFGSAVLDLPGFDSCGSRQRRRGRVRLRFRFAAAAFRRLYRVSARLLRRPIPRDRFPPDQHHRESTRRRAPGRPRSVPHGTMPGSPGPPMPGHMLLGNVVPGAIHAGAPTRAPVTGFQRGERCRRCGRGASTSHSLGRCRCRHSAGWNATLSRRGVPAENLVERRLADELERAALPVGVHPLVAVHEDVRDLAFTGRGHGESLSIFLSP